MAARRVGIPFLLSVIAALTNCIEVKQSAVHQYYSECERVEKGDVAFTTVVGNATLKYSFLPKHR